MFHKQLKNIVGASTLILTVCLLFLTNIIIIYTAKTNTTRQKIATNVLQNSQALAAAEGGLEFSIQYLQNNAAARIFQILQLIIIILFQYAL
jgi:Tfp pilus assembly protein PilX